jgi:hypothetical protein
VQGSEAQKQSDRIEDILDKILKGRLVKWSTSNRSLEKILFEDVGKNELKTNYRFPVASVQQILYTVVLVSFVDPSIPYTRRERSTSNLLQESLTSFFHQLRLSSSILFSRGQNPKFGRERRSSHFSAR